MKKISVLLILLLTLASMNVLAVYHPDEITDNMIKKWINETKEMEKEYSSLQAGSTNHSIDLGARGIPLRMALVRSAARKIMEDSYEMQKKYQNPTPKDFNELVSNNDTFSVMQILIVEDRSNRDPDDMHVVFVVDGEIIQPVNSNEGQSNYDSSLSAYQSIKSYDFKYDDFPSHKEYKNGESEILLKHISSIGEKEVEVEWGKIR